jgi:hypothetical protein
MTNLSFQCGENEYAPLQLGANPGSANASGGGKLGLSQHRSALVAIIFARADQLLPAHGPERSSISTACIRLSQNLINGSAAAETPNRGCSRVPGEHRRLLANFGKDLGFGVAGDVMGDGDGPIRPAPLVCIRRSGITSRSKLVSFSISQTSCNSAGPRGPAVWMLRLSETGAPVAWVRSGRVGFSLIVRFLFS